MDYKEKLEILSADEEIIGLYNAEVEEEKIRKTIEQAAERKGLKEGLKEGFEQGIEQGVEQTKKEMVINLNSIGMSIKDIATSVGKSIEEVEDIISENIN